ncbi:type VI secretion system baseplate subunit TssG [Cereibacter sphaeroides]|uniref:type VI secretion system baseplate subunit TssG n=1 Tax=Cereibacter sphaeroides TaxID=1063 RepID=UPI001F3C2F36|nr:type VI secretion system baseplate subunit TssG [Cereibacter sphaeroides]MCE6959787.1 type VI secretion system baseplate subunit TssG [Cereibacter sphaeroides]MCE6974641.1 type VI secretion system baseplate subunit TssG [Cereibacter sphaeroides]
MADDARHPPADLIPEGTGFFQLLRRLETVERRFGRTGGAGDDPARLGQRLRLHMATRDIAALRPARGGRPAEVDVEVLGLFGPEGALPLHLTRRTMQRLSERWFAGDEDGASDTAFLDFCNMLQHRHLALFWRAWADSRPEVQAEVATGGPFEAMLRAMAGIGPGSRLDSLKRRHATALSSEVQGPERLTRILADRIGAPVALREFVGHWMPVPPAAQSRLGRSHTRLGRTASIGPRSFQRQTRAELRVGPVDLPLYLRLVEEAGLGADIGHLIRVAAPRGVDFDLRPLLRRDAIPAPQLGTIRLGRTAWLAGGRHRDAADLVLRGVTAGKEAA